MRLGFKDFFLKFDKLHLPAFFFTGPENFLKLRAKEKLVQKPQYAGFTKTRLDGQNLDIQALWEALSTPGLFSTGEIFIIERCNRINAANKKSLLEILEDWEEQDSNSRILIFISEEQRQDTAEPLEGHFMANSKAYHVFFPVFSEDEALSWAKGELRRRSIKASGQALQQMTARCSNDLYVWFNLIRSIELYLEANATLELGDVNELLGSSATQEEKLIRNLQELILQAFNSKPVKASLLGSVLKTSEQILSASPEPEEAAALRVIRTCSDLIYELGVAKSGAYSSFGKRHPELYHEIKTATPRWTWKEIGALYAASIKAEKNIKTGKLCGYSTLQRFAQEFLGPVLDSGGNSGGAVIGLGDKGA